MPRTNSIIGRQFGMLTVLKEMNWGDATKVVITQTYCDVKQDKVFERKPHYKQYLCQCECGNQVILESRNLKSMTSCGCLMKKNLDLTGMRFGKLTVLNKVDWKASKTIDIVKDLGGIKTCCFYEEQKGQTSWLCQCDCGNKTVVTTGSLTSENTKSCGCNKEFKPVETIKKLKEDLTGKIFDHLTVVKFAGYDHCGCRHYRKWLCRCDCGAEKEIREIALKRKDNVKSCGCAKHNRRNING